MLFSARIWANVGTVLGGVRGNSSTPFAMREQADDWLVQALRVNREAGRDVDGEIQEIFQHSDLVGKRVEIPVHYDMWARGARFGVVTVYRHGRDGQSDYVKVKLDHPQARRQLKVWRHDWPYMKRI